MTVYGIFALLLANLLLSLYEFTHEFVLWPPNIILFLFKFDVLTKSVYLANFFADVHNLSHSWSSGSTNSRYFWVLVSAKMIFNFITLIYLICNFEIVACLYPIVHVSNFVPLSLIVLLSNLKLFFTNVDYGMLHLSNESNCNI